LQIYCLHNRTVSKIFDYHIWDGTDAFIKINGQTLFPTDTSGVYKFFKWSGDSISAPSVKVSWTDTGKKMKLNFYDIDNHFAQMTIEFIKNKDTYIFKSH